MYPSQIKFIFDSIHAIVNTVIYIAINILINGDIFSKYLFNSTTIS